ncbi:hypothetical protein Tco_1006066 [Tanacetum coccineum]|uniref:Uncharacterized protein n=1 Tax=Tanacetum coccineum TaxID=301880 RepID=A0ABQ5FGZ2_9ASTR
MKAQAQAKVLIICFDRKSTTGGWSFLGSRLISWQLLEVNSIYCHHTTKATSKETTKEETKESHEIPPFCGSMSILLKRSTQLENHKGTSQAQRIYQLKERVKKLERRNKSRTPGLKRLRKVGRSAQVVSSEDERAEVEKVVSTAKVTTVSATTTTVDELTLAQTLIEIKATNTLGCYICRLQQLNTAVTRPKARGVVVQESSEFTKVTSPSQLSQLPQANDKGKAKMIGPEKPLKKKDQILINEEIAQKLQAQLNAELKKEEKLVTKREDAKLYMEIVPDDEVAIDAIPLATKSPIIVDWKIIKEGKMGYFQIIRADGSSRRYSSMIRMLQNIDREDLETLWKLVKAKHGNTRPEEAYERVLWGDLKVMFEPDVESEVWRNLQGYNVTVWKLFSSSGVHFVRFQNLHIFMLVEKKYPLTPATITKMLNKKLQTDHWNEMCYQLLKLMTKQVKNPRSV